MTTLLKPLINPYDYVDREDLFAELTVEQKVYVLMELFGETYDRAEALATIETHYPGIE